MSCIFTCWARKLLNQLENHSFSLAPYQPTWIKIHWNSVFIETARAWLILSGPFILYGVAYQKADQDIMKNGPTHWKEGPTHLKKGLFYLVDPLAMN